jgi:hypothetical protein
MANSPLPLAGGVGGGLVYSTDHTDYHDTPSPNPSRRREGNR